MHLIILLEHDGQTYVKFYQVLGIWLNHQFIEDSSDKMITMKIVTFFIVYSKHIKEFA